jgi:uncharacterized membrane protein
MMEATREGPGRIALRWALAAFFTAAGLNHFREPGLYAGMMPPWLPWPSALIAVSGVCEVLGGIGILARPTRRAAAWGLVALLAAVFPANLHVALMGRMPGFTLSPAVLWLRLPFQPVLAAAVLWAGAAPRTPSRAQASRAG